MTPKIIDIEEQKYVGIQIEMSLVNNKTGMLWGSFMPRRNEIKKRVNPLEVVSLQGTDPAVLMTEFRPTQEFVKWALAEVSSFDGLPEGMEKFVLPAGKYAVFTHKGTGQEGFVKTLMFILNSWLPNSEFDIDNRPNFEVLGEKYKRTDPSSEEDIWIPIK